MPINKEIELFEKWFDEERKPNDIQDYKKFFLASLKRNREEVLEEVKRNMPEIKELEDTNGLSVFEYFENQFGEGYARGRDEGFNQALTQTHKVIDKSK